MDWFVGDQHIDLPWVAILHAADFSQLCVIDQQHAFAGLFHHGPRHACFVQIEVECAFFTVQGNRGYKSQIDVKTANFRQREFSIGGGNIADNATPQQY